MFETAELGRSVPKKLYRKQVPILRQELLELQEELREVDHSQVILVFAGVDGGGKGHTVNLLNEWMDARWLITRAFDEPADVERERPEFWRYWLALPPRGRIAMFLSSWYSPPVLDRVYMRSDEKEFDARLDRILAFETELADDGALILKFWMHLSREVQLQRLGSLEADPLTRARITDRDRRNWERYDDFIAAAERVVTRTSTGKAPWAIVEGADVYHRSLAVGTAVRDALRRHIDEIKLDQRVRAEVQARVEAEEKKRLKKEKEKEKSKERRKSRGKSKAADEPAQVEAAPDHSDTAASPDQLFRPMTVLSQLDMSQTISKEDYREQLNDLQARLHIRHLEARDRGISTILVFEGPDAGGKGGAIRRLTGALDAQNYQVHGVAAPTDEERAQHYLWRFWRHLARAGRLTFFDRSWYGRVLVERVQGFATEEQWRRAYSEINDFEDQLIEHGIVLVKYWLHITKDEQLARFKLRQETPYKRWKLTEEDWRNRENWDAYEQAVHDMVHYTSTRVAPWTLVEGNDKRYARIKTLRILCERLDHALGHDAAAPGQAQADPGAPTPASP